MSGLDGAQVLVTGGAGFIGSHLVEAALALGAARVLVLDDLSNGSLDNLKHLSENSRCSFTSGDVRDAAKVADALVGIDVVFHLACLGVRHSLHAPIHNHEVNATGSLNVLEQARLAGTARTVYVSSSEVFGSARYTPMDEEHPTWPETVYGGGKLAGEAYARAYYRTYGMDTVVVRPFNTYGPRSHFEGDSGEVIPRTIVRALAGESPLIFGDGHQSRDFMYVTDTARAIAMLGSHDEAIGRTINLGSGSEISMNDLCAVITSAVGRDDLQAIHLDPRPGDVRRLLGDPTLMRSLTGFESTVGFAEGIGRLVAWLRSQPTSVSDMLSRVTDRNWENPSSGDNPHSVPQLSQAIR